MTITLRCGRSEHGWVADLATDGHVFSAISAPSLELLLTDIRNALERLILGDVTAPEAADGLNCCVAEAIFNAARPDGDWEYEKKMLAEGNFSTVPYYRRLASAALYAAEARGVGEHPGTDVAAANNASCQSEEGRSSAPDREGP